MEAEAEAEAAAEAAAEAMRIGGRIRRSHQKAIRSH